METVLITGSNRGIGLELTRQYLQKQMRVFATCRAPENALALSELKQTHKDAIRICPLEVTDAVDLRAENIIACPVHPGWVQTDMGGANADFTVQESASGLIQLISRLQLSDSGHFLKWNGEEHPW